MVLYHFSFVSQRKGILSYIKYSTIAPISQALQVDDVAHLYGSTKALIHMPWHAQRVAVTEADLRAQQILVKLVGKELDLLVVVVYVRL